MFSQALPEYLAIGMSAKEFYDGPAWLTVSYRKANRTRREQANFDAYLQATYIYEALVTALGGMFSKQRVEWRKEPYELQRSCDQEAKIGRDAKRSKGYERGLAYMQTYMFRHKRYMDAKKAMGEEGTAPGNQQDQVR